MGALRALMRLEAAIRRAGTSQELFFLVANEARALLRARQIFVLEDERPDQPGIVAISGLPTVERGSPLVQDLERGIRHLAAQAGPKGLFEPREFRLESLGADQHSPALSAYALQEMLWLPLPPSATSPSGGLLLARETPWSEADIGIAHHLADATNYARHALAARPRRKRRRIGSKAAVAGAVLLLALGFVPVPMAILAPLEVIAREPYVVSSGLDGIVEALLVKPNETVSQGQPVVRLVGVELRNKLEIAEREVQVAAARLQKARQLAFADARGRHEMALMQAEYDLRVAERNFARDQLDKTELKAGRAGIAVYGDGKDIIGRPVAVGDRLMEIADPASIDVQIDIPVGDALVVKPGAEVKLFLDSNPLDPVGGRIVRADYKARPRDGATLAYRAIVQFDEAPAPAPRLGVRGTAQVYGEDVPLWFYLLRRPISAFRQWSGL
ncbi:efflux RND transporter periplasmic adaptor subunit [Bosea beijingensis]|uniref:efflux RND transporter periplasmic adaptor subunit n=1 Tax=Bosea beijingensis TaxID=3068632 RepID=UPI0027419EB5|nr:HlyD family efflux transporter periplasmic adaptor subunit [Bosea sp. REN20]